jgi:hypothetical protein
MHSNQTTQLVTWKRLMKIKLQEGKLIARFIEEFQGAPNEIATS